MIKQFPEDYLRTEDTVMVSDGDNDYSIWSNGIEEFKSDAEYLVECEECSDEWYQGCEDFNEKWGDYQI